MLLGRIGRLICSEHTIPMITLSELVARSELGLRVVAADARLDRAIQGVHTSDLPHPGRYLLQGELVLTNGLWYPSIKAETWVSELALAGVAAMGFGLGTPHPSVPGEVASACERHLLPLLEIPEDLSFVTISDAASVGGDQRSMLRRHLERARSMVQTMTEGGGPTTLLDVLRDATGHDAALLDAGARIVGATGEPPTGDQAALAISLARKGRLPAEIVPGLTAFGTASGHRAHDLVLVVRAALTELDDEGRVAINQVTDHLELHAARQRSGREAERALTLELVESSRSGTIDEKEHGARLRALGFDPAEPLFALAGDHEIGQLETALEAVAGPFVSAVFDGATIALVQPLADDEVALAASALVELGSSPTFGVGTPGVGPEGLGRSIAEALVAIRLARSRPQGERIVGLGQIGSIAHLLGMIERDVLAGYRTMLLGPIERWDLERKAELGPTLRSFLENGCRWRATAATLHIHHNTLRYRLKRVEELTGRDLSLVADRLDLQIALLVPP